MYVLVSISIIMSVVNSGIVKSVIQIYTIYWFY